MTTAYDFPDLNISPILGEEESDHETVEENLANLQGSHHVDTPIQDILKGLSISESDPSRNVFSSGASEVESCTDAQRRPTCLHGNSQRGESFDSSSEEAFAALECEMKRSLFSVAESCDIAADLQESFCSILSGCRISVEMGCCTESSEDVRSRLRRMGAVVSRRFSETTTHVVFSLGGRAAILRRAFSLPKRPFLVDPHWVYECFNTRTRVPEEQFSLYDCRFLLNALRRSMDTRCPSENTELSHGDNTGASCTTSTSHVNEERLMARSTLTEVTFNRSMSASELLMKINLLSRRLDRIGGASCVLGNRCPSAQKGTLADGVFQRRGATDLEQPPYITMRRKVLRRRTHGAFPLEYRDPFCVAVQLNAESREELEAVYGRRRQTDFPGNNVDENNKDPKRTDQPHKVNTQRKVIARENNEEAVAAAQMRSSQKCLRAIENSSEIGGLLGFRAPSHGGVYGPLVETASSLINNLQLASTSEEFVKKKQAPGIAKNRNGIVFTGFMREIERDLRSTAVELGLKVQAKITNRTYCVISANGDRTLNTLRAIVSGIPVVKAEWLDACTETNKFLPLDRFHFDRWHNLIQKRGQHCRLLSEFGKVFVCDGCSPPANDIEWLIIQSGGEVTNDPCECVLVVAPHDHSLEILCSEDVEFPPPVVVEKYILDCISENKILEIDGYMEHDVVDEIC